MPHQRILVVDDTAGARRLAERMLISLDYAVMAAQSATEAIALIDRGETFDVLLTDIMMPGMNGIELARLLRQRLPTLRIVFTSGFSEVTASELDALGAIYVSKPYRKAEIAQVLRAFLAPR